MIAEQPHLRQLARGVRLFWVPAAIRGDNDPAQQFDTSNGNQFIGNQFGVRARRASARPNGIDFFWDEQGMRQLLARQHGRPAARSPATRRRCRGAPTARLFMPANPAKSAAEVPCAQWDPKTNPDPPGCTWFTTPPKPARNEAVARHSASCSSPGWGRCCCSAIATAGRPRPRTGTARLQWKEKPSLILVPSMPQDRILTGQLRNASLHSVDLDTEKVRILDAEGPRAALDRRCSRSTSRTASTRGRGT